MHVQEKSVIECSGKLSFSIQHPDLLSALVTPRDAFTAEFESVTCYIKISAAKDGLSTKKHALKRKRTEQLECIRTQQPDDMFVDDEHLMQLAPDDQRAIDAFIQSLYATPPQPGRGKSIPKPGRSDLINEKIEFSERLKQFFEIALEILVLGSRKQYKGITAGDYTRTECLTRLAPGVFNMPYLKVIFYTIGLYTMFMFVLS